MENPYTGTAPLLRSVLFNYEAGVELLIRAGSDVNATNYHGISPLYAAHALNIVAMLLAAGADPRLPNVEPCLMGPVVRGEVDVTMALIAAGADPSAASPRSGWTSLYIATLHCRLEIVDILLASWVDALVIDGKGKTPLRYVHCGTPGERQAIITSLVGTSL